MSRGWESKDVEAQMNAAEERQNHGKIELTQEQLIQQRERESIELSRTRVLQDLSTAQNPPYREQLKESLKFLDEKLAQLNKPGLPESD